MHEVQRHLSASDADAASIEARAKGIAVEQSVEMPLDAIDDDDVLADIVGQVEDIQDQGDGRSRCASHSPAAPSAVTPDSF